MWRKQRYYCICGIMNLVYCKLTMKTICFKCVPRLLTIELEFTRHKQDFLRQYVTTDETWIHSFTTELERQSLEWREAGDSHGSTKSQKKRQEMKKKKHFSSIQCTVSQVKKWLTSWASICFHHYTVQIYPPSITTSSKRCCRETDFTRTRLSKLSL